MLRAARCKGGHYIIHDYNNTNSYAIPYLICIIGMLVTNTITKSSYQILQSNSTTLYSRFTGEHFNEHFAISPCLFVQCNVNLITALMLVGEKPT